MSKATKKKSQLLGKGLIVFLGIILINVLADSFYKRFDLTKEKRFTLSNSTKNLLAKLDDEVYCTIYLDGDLPLDYKRLKSSTRDMLNEFNLASSGLINYEFEDILAEKETKDKEKILQDLYRKGLRIERPEVKPDEAPTDKYIIPAGVVFYKGQEYPLNLMKREFGSPLEEEINGSIELLEYEIGNVLRKGVVGKELRIAFTDGHGELGMEETADIANALNEFYEVSRININLTDSNCYKMFTKEVTANPDKPVLSVFVESLIKKLNTYSGLIIAKPVTSFTEPEKFVIDQYIMNGGKVIFLVESLIAEMDSVAKYGKVMTANHNHNLDDLLFHYGVKVQPTLVQDLQCHGIPAINQQTNRPGFWPWWFYPLFNPADDNPITRNLENIWGQYCSTMDTTSRQTLKKTILLKTSENSRVAHNPVMISLDLLKVRPDPRNFNKGGQISAVLVEGEFSSPFKHRTGVKRAFDIEYKKENLNNAMIVIGDGDLIRNQVSKDKSQIYPLGYDRFATQSFGQPVEFANKKFFLNCVDYLCDESNLIEVRSREVVLRLLDKNRIKKERMKWQSINMVLPILAVILFGLFNALYRRRRWN
jgi:ABC-2 type transport system permease protein